MAIRHDRQTTRTELGPLERVFCRWFYFHLRSKIFYGRLPSPPIDPPFPCGHAKRTLLSTSYRYSIHEYVHFLATIMSVSVLWYACKIVTKKHIRNVVTRCKPRQWYALSRQWSGSRNLSFRPTRGIFVIIVFIYHTGTEHKIQKLNPVNKSMEGYQRSYSSLNWPPMPTKQNYLTWTVIIIIIILYV